MKSGNKDLELIMSWLLIFSVVLYFFTLQSCKVFEHTKTNINDSSKASKSDTATIKKNQNKEDKDSSYSRVTTIYDTTVREHVIEYRPIVRIEERGVLKENKTQVSSDSTGGSKSDSTAVKKEQTDTKKETSTSLPWWVFLLICVGVQLVLPNILNLLPFKVSITKK